MPTLFVVSLMFFALQQCVKGNILLETGEGTELMSVENRASALRQQAQRTGVDQPVFYCSITTAAQPDTLYKIFPKTTRHRLACLTAATGNWPAVEQYEQYLQQFIAALADSLPGVTEIRPVLYDLLSAEKLSDLVSNQSIIAQIAARMTGFRADSTHRNTKSALDSLSAAITRLQTRQDHWKPLLPAWHWHGTHNQYHKWLTGFATGHLGYSLNTQKPVGTTIFLSLCTTLFINGIAFLLSFLIAIPLGVAMSRRAHRSFDRLMKSGVLALHSVPVFWLGSLLILWFTTPGFGLNILPGVGIEQWDGENQPFFSWISNNAGKFVLPIATLTLHALAVLTLQMRGAMLETLQQDYIRTARAKGLKEQQVFWRHAFRNALFPIITTLSSTIPAIISGSLVIDFLFALPGMGSKTQEAFRNGDIPLLSAILMTIAILTICCQLIADIVYAWADPRVRFDKTSRKN